MFQRVDHFPSRVRYLALWRHRWLILNIINQIAYGEQWHAVSVVRMYGGDDFIGRTLYRAAREIIEVQEERRS